MIRNVKRIKEKEFIMKNSDLISDYDNSENKEKSTTPKYIKFNNKNIMLNNDEEEIP